MAPKNESVLFDPSFDYLESPLDGINKTPITYYGGKQSMASIILSLIPDHRLYCEPFLGGAAIFFAKQRSELEVINDINPEVVNFYKVCRSDFNVLNKLIQSTPHSRLVHKMARHILKNTEKYDKFDRAWALWVQTVMSFGSVVFGGYAYERHRNGTLKTFVNKKLQFTPEISERLRGVSIACTDALKVIKKYDAEDAFFYIDPPYFNSDMSFYKGYTKKDFIDLLRLLKNINGTFLLSSYPSEVLDQFTGRNKWFNHSISKKVAVTYQTNKEKKEMLTANYDLTSISIGYGDRLSDKILPVGGTCHHLHQKARALKLGLQLY